MPDNTGMPTRIGRYAIESEIGRGGMGVVYLARDEKLGKFVALKILTEAGALSPDLRARLRQEARAAAILNHPSIVGVYDYDDEGGAPFIVFEYVEGSTLDKAIAGGPLPEEKIIEIGIQVADGLAYAHERGILHRDIKPQNIIVGPEGRTKILDFGLAKKMPSLVNSDGFPTDADSVATVAGTIVGTVQYMSPEQVAGESLDGRTDIFSLGTVLFEMATGKNPFLGANLTSTVGKIMASDPPRPHLESCKVSEALTDVILKSLQKKREDRYQSAMLLREDLTRARSVQPRSLAAGPDSLRRRRSEAVTKTTRLDRPQVIPRQLARTLLMLLQFLYLALYAVALVKHLDVVLRLAHLSGDFVGHLEAARKVATALLVTGCCGIPVRLYLLFSVAFDDPETGRQFHKLFPFLFVLDEIWALTPLLLIGKWPAGVAVICVVLLTYLPISHRNLIRNAY